MPNYIILKQIWDAEVRKEKSLKKTKIDAEQDFKEAKDAFKQMEKTMEE